MEAFPKQEQKIKQAETKKEQKGKIAAPTLKLP